MSKEKIAQVKSLLKQALAIVKELPEDGDGARSILDTYVVDAYLRTDYYARKNGFLEDAPAPRVLKGTQQSLPIKKSNSTLAPAAHIPMLRGPMTAGMDVAQQPPTPATPAPRKRGRPSKADLDALG